MFTTHTERQIDYTRKLPLHLEVAKCYVIDHDQYSYVIFHEEKLESYIKSMNEDCKTSAVTVWFTKG